jgi:hypothetical protein
MVSRDSHTAAKQIAAVARLFQCELLAKKNRAGAYFTPEGKLQVAHLKRNMTVWSSGEFIMATLALALWEARVPKKLRFDPERFDHIVTQPYRSDAYAAMQIRYDLSREEAMNAISDLLP